MNFPLFPVFLRPIRLVVLLSLWLVFPLEHNMQAEPASPCAVSVADLRCESLPDPEGIDETVPRLSWLLHAVNPEGRGAAQTAYQILVASAPEKLARDEGDLWDSQQVKSSRSFQVDYAGKPLPSRQACWWKVRVWDQNAVVSGWSQPARWSMGLLQPGDWHAKWIGLDEFEGSGLGGATTARWIWHPEAGNPAVNAPVGQRFFKRELVLPADAHVTRARMWIAADNHYDLSVNGDPLTGKEKQDFHHPAVIDLTRSLRPGVNLLAVTAENAPITSRNDSAPNPAGLIARLRIEMDQGQPLEIVTDGSWSSADQPAAEADTNKSWQPARELGAYDMAPWNLAARQDRTALSARYLRREFSIEKKIKRATVYYSGLGLSELYLNGQKIGDEVLSPGLTDYDKRAFYVTHDVTAQLTSGANAIGAILGNGRYFAPRLSVPTPTRTFGYPKLLLQLELEYEDGTTSSIVSGEDWRLTDQGPLGANNEYDGEVYDARLEMTGWNRPGYFAEAWRNWRPPALVAAPKGVMRSPMMYPIRVVETVKPVSVTETRPGVYVFDLGQNISGWCRLRVQGPSGAHVALRHAESLHADGTLYVENLRSAAALDQYTLKGAGEETYEPRFTYHGFRYVEVTGWPGKGKPPLSAIEGCVVHDDLPSAGSFECSDPTLNRIYHNIRWGVRDNYRSMPTDCPQRDERQGWLGDRSAECLGETYLFDIEKLYSKWITDMADTQREDGALSDVAPAYWPFYTDNVTWPATFILAPGVLYDQYGDRRTLERNYPAMKRWMEYMRKFVKDDIMTRDNYGDWCAPPEDLKLIHTQDPLRKTAPAVMGTTYYYHCLREMARYANMLGQNADFDGWETQAERMKKAFHEKFYHADTHSYDNGSATSSVLPLAFGLVPDDCEQAVFDQLVNKLLVDGKPQIKVGLVGAQWLMRTLTRHGRMDLAYELATRRDYPSWGYMAEHGATTMWELWNGNTADPAMNSQNHVMLVGDLGIWLHEAIAGNLSIIEGKSSGWAEVGPTYQTLQTGLEWVKVEHRTPLGTVSRAWRRGADGRVIVDITIPPNMETLHPASGSSPRNSSGPFHLEKAPPDPTTR